MNGEHVDDLIDLYALGALEPGEQSIVDSHLDDCVECRALLADSRRIVELLAWTPEQRTPPPDLQARIRRRIEPLDRQERGSKPQRRFAFWPLRIPFFSLRAGLIATAFALALVLGGWNVMLLQEVSDLRAELQRWRPLELVLRESGVRYVTLEPQPAAPHAWGSMMINPTGQDAYLIAEGLPPLPEDKTYQLWLANDEGRANGGTSAR